MQTNSTLQPSVQLSSTATNELPGILQTGIIGTGNSGRALAAYLSSQGHQVHILGRSEEKVAFLGSQSTIKAEGKILGEFPIHSAGCDITRFAAAVEFIFIATVTTAYLDIATKLAPVLTDRHKIILFSAKLGASLLFETALRNAHAMMPSIIETDALFACRIDPTNEGIWIRGIKQWTLFSSVTHTKTKDNADILCRFFPGLSPAQNIIQRGLTDFGAVAHASISLANMNQISRQIPFRFYYDGMTTETIRLLETVEGEFGKIAEAYGSDLIPMKELLNQYYTCDTTNLYTAMTTVPNYSNSMSPNSLHHRFLYEDICSTLVPAAKLAKLAGVATPILEALISIASVLMQRDLRSEGRSLKTLGLDGMSYKEVVNYVNS